MKTRDNIQDMLTYLQAAEEQAIDFDHDAIIAGYQDNKAQHSLAIKILTVFGGILASLAFLGFLLVSGMYDSGIALCFLGVICIVAAVWINRQYDLFIFDTISISCFIIGFFTLGAGMLTCKAGDSFVCLVFIFFSAAALIAVQRYIISFISVLVINGSILALLVENDAYAFIAFYTASLAWLTFYLFRKEARALASRHAFTMLYEPLRPGLILSLLSALFLMGKKALFPFAEVYVWLCSIAIIAVIVHLITKLYSFLNIVKAQHRVIICMLTIIVLIPTGLSPAISGSLLIILLCFMVNYKTGLVTGILSFIYFISQFYYDMRFSLLIKSELLLISGLFFIALYLLTNKKLAGNEKI
jgi:hypothetical protein